MSLYIIGSLVPSTHSTSELLQQRLGEIGQRTGITLSNDLDEDDKDYLTSVMEPLTEGTYFILQDEPTAVDITVHWIEAMTIARSHISHQVSDITTIGMNEVKVFTFDELFFTKMQCTSLGSCISAIIHENGVEHGCISIADGAAEGDVHIKRDECVREIFKTMIMTWDCLPNLTYCW